MLAHFPPGDNYGMEGKVEEVGAGMLTFNLLFHNNAFEIACNTIGKYYGKWSICSSEQMLHFP